MSKIAQQSMQSLMLTMRLNGAELATGTGFIVNTAKGLALVTNRHNVTGRYQGTGKPIAPSGAVPNEIVIHHPAVFDKTHFVPEWVACVEPLYADGTPTSARRWKEHPTYGSRVDFVLLPLTQTRGTASIPYGMNDGATIAVGPGEPVSIVGFPFAISAGGRFAVWSTAYVASELDADYNDLPLFLVDCRTRPGQAGAPVIAQRTGMVKLIDGRQKAAPGFATRFLGIYSGRVHKDSDIGMVWKASAIQELIDSLGPPITLFKLWPAAPAKPATPRIPPP
jgi:hypothetical protein